MKENIVILEAKTEIRVKEKFSFSFSCVESNRQRTNIEFSQDGKKGLNVSHMLFVKLEEGYENLGVASCVENMKGRKK